VRPLLVTEADYANLSLLDSPRLRGWLASATRVRSDAMPGDVVTMNSRVVCTELESGVRRVLSVVYPQDADDEAGRLCVLGEAGLSLLGASPRQTLQWRGADGALRRWRVEAVAYQPEHDLRNNLVLRAR
jgi:regulator of nucleoside diphosphate kinase